MGLPFFGSAVLGKLGNPFGVLEESPVNGIDYSGSRSISMSGGMDMSIQISIPVPPAAIFINTMISMGTSVNWSTFTSEVTMRTMDMDGDGLPDRVLRVPGTGYLYVRRNLAGRVGLLRRIVHPQGGRSEVEYRYMPGTEEMPQGTYVMSEVRRHDGDGEPGRIGVGYGSAHEYVTEFEYEGGYYDREEKESYGFREFRVRASDGTVTETETLQGEYYVKGMPARHLVWNEGWSREVQYGYREAPYAQVLTEQTTVEEGGERIRTRREYGYDGYGNVAFLRESGDGIGTLEAEIGYWNHEGGGAYYHGHPEEISVYGIREGRREVLRRRRGEYEGVHGALVRQTAESGRPAEQGGAVVTEISWDGYGNIAEIRNGGWVRYEYDDETRQYPEVITEGGSGAGPYESRIEWDHRRGVKRKERDENGEEIRYEYDRYGRIAAVYSPYDGETPAVRYEYHREPGRNWYAVTENKVSFDPGDGQVLRTVVVIDGLGRSLVTGKDGAVRGDDGADEAGWNVSGGTAYDEKGRAVARGQGEFLPGTGVEVLRSFAYPAGLKLPTETAYDTQDRPVRVELPDGSVERTAYGIRESRSVITATDPLGNGTEQVLDARGNILEVRRRDREGRLLTRAGYEYNSMGEMIRAEDVQGFELTVEYDRLGRRTALESADIGRKEYYFDRYGNLSSLLS
jgi:YD repeat-containing protein